MHCCGGSGIPWGLAQGCYVSPQGALPGTRERKGGTWAASAWPPPHFFLAPQGPPWPLPALGRGAGSAQVPHRLHHDHPAAPGEGLSGRGGGSGCWQGGHPMGWLVLYPRDSQHVPKAASLPCIPRQRGLGWPSIRCGNTARMKRWWPQPKSSSRTGSGCWVSDDGERKEPPHPSLSHLGTPDL